MGARPSARPFPSDAVLVARLRDGDDAAFALVLDAWSAGMLRLARSFVSTHDFAAEVVQETWLAVIKGLATFEGRSSLRTWVYRILVNTAERRGVRENRAVPWSFLPTADEEGPTVDLALRPVRRTRHRLPRGRLDAESLRRFVDHRGLCTGCARYLDQIRWTIELVARAAGAGPAGSG